MKIIGKLSDGSELLSITAEDRRRLDAIRDVFGSLALGDAADEERAAAPAAKPVSGKPAAPASKPVVGVQRIICKQCNKPFLRKGNDRRECCSEKCKREFGLAYARKWYAKKGKRPAAAKPVVAAWKAKVLSGRNPADPMLTDEERAALKADRLAIIKAAAERQA